MTRAPTDKEFAAHRKRGGDVAWLVYYALRGKRGGALRGERRTSVLTRADDWHAWRDGRAGFVVLRWTRVVNGRAR